MEKALMNELSQGKERAEQLMSRLRQSSSKEKRDLLVAQILSSYEKSLSILNALELESPHSFGNSSPTSVSFDQQENTVSVSKKRKTMPRWTKQVCLGTGVEGSLGDGYSWRKYGQKDILGSNHPRGYFRCTYRPSKGCLATKQVQRSDQDSSLFEVTYRGLHTCCTRSSQQPIDKLSKKLLAQQETNFPQLEEREKNPTHSQSTLLNLKTSVEVKTEDSGTEEGNIFVPFSFSSSSIESETVDDLFLSEAIMETGFGMPLSSSTDSESKYLSDFIEIISFPTSATDSPVGNNYCSDFEIDKVDFGLNFPFDSPEFFS